MGLPKFLYLLVPILLSPQFVSGSGTKVIKVLPFYLDREGRCALSPSLFDRDAYQAHLRRRSEERSGLRFDVQWRAREVKLLTLRVEVRGGAARQATSATIETAVRHIGGLNKWTSLQLTGEDYQRFGELTAWRATLWDGQTLLAEQKSFLW